MKKIILTMALFFIMSCGATIPNTAQTETPTATTPTQKASHEARTENRATNTPSLDVAIVTAEYLRLRGGAGNEYPVLAVLEKGQELEIIERGEWCRVSAGEKIGFVYSSFIVEEK